MLSEAQKRWQALLEQLRCELLQLQGQTLSDKEKVGLAMKEMSAVVRQINALDNPYYRPVQQHFFREMFTLIRRGECDNPKTETLPTIIEMVERGRELIVNGAQA